MKALPKSNTLLFSTLLLLNGCFQAADEVNESPIETSVILAKVNNQVITEKNVALVINQTFANNPMVTNNPEIRKKILASLVASKAMNEVMLKELDQEQINDIKIRAQHYQEELFVKAYLQQHAVPEPVTSAMINDYYHNNLEKFGKVDVKIVEVLQRKSKLNENERDAILTNLATINVTDNWQNFVENQGKSLSLSYIKTKFYPGIFDKEVSDVIETLNVDENSKIVFVQGQPYIIRVIAVQTLPAKPLSSVSVTIRKKLAALQLKKAVKESSKQVIEKMDVVYMELDD